MQRREKDALRAFRGSPAQHRPCVFKPGAFPWEEQGQKIKEQSSVTEQLEEISLGLSSSTLSKCCHATVALLYPFTWQHTYIPVLPPSMIDIVCSPTPFLIGLLSSSLPRLKELPVEEVSHVPHSISSSRLS